MLETLGSSLQDFALNIRLVDVLDVALISVVFYLVINWLIRSISRRTLIGLTVLLIIYMLARISGMYLTELLIQALFVIILIALVVVFQSDIRRTVDRIGNWRFFSNNETNSQASQATDILTEASSSMAENKTGALIVIRGQESWDRHIEGGIPIKGQISTELLHSIFNPTAPGHDGAVLLDGDNIVRFGVHLPLSKNIGENFPGGTRHAAALGISEHCDAFVVVVSEERGTISIAHHGTLTELDSTSELKNLLDDFWQEHYQSQDSTFIEGWKLKNLQTAIASITLAGILWFAFAYQSGTVYRTFSVPIEYRNLQSSNIVVEDSLPMQARVTIAGPEQAFRALDPSNLVITFNLNDEDLYSNELFITENDINLSNDLQLYDVDPRILNISAQEVEQMQRPIKVTMSGTLSSELELTSVEAEPEVVTLTVPTGTIIEDSIATEPIDLSEIDESTELKRDILLPSGVTLPEGESQEIVISIEVREKDNTSNS